MYYRQYQLGIEMVFVYDYGKRNLPKKEHDKVTMGAL